MGRLDHEKSVMMATQRHEMDVVLRVRMKLSPHFLEDTVPIPIQNSLIIEYMDMHMDR